MSKIGNEILDFFISPAEANPIILAGLAAGEFAAISFLAIYSANKIYQKNLQEMGVEMDPDTLNTFPILCIDFSGYFGRDPNDTIARETGRGKLYALDVLVRQKP